jgi:hypothetical protein
MQKGFEAAVTNTNADEVRAHMVQYASGYQIPAWAGLSCLLCCQRTGDTIQEMKSGASKDAPQIRFA